MELAPRRQELCHVSCRLHTQGGKGSGGLRSHSLGISPIGSGREGGIEDAG